MNKEKIIVEIFSAPNCSNCGRAITLVQEVANDMNDFNIEIIKLNVVDKIDYAVELNIRATPSIVINGKLVFTSIPDKKMLMKKLLETN